MPNPLFKEVLLCIKTKNTASLKELLEKDIAYAFALKDCCQRGFVDGVDVRLNALNEPVFQVLDGCALTSSGINFLRNS